jgi:hypothetical protein
MAQSQSVNDSGLLAAAVGAGGYSGLPTSPPQDPYRFYQCRFEPGHPTTALCRRISTKEMHDVIVGVPTKLVPIQSWVPEWADKHIIRWRFFYERSTQFE